MAPVFPLTVHFNDGRTQRFTTPEGLASTLEWFDTHDPSDSHTDEHGTVTDAHGHPVRLQVEALEIVRMELADPAQPQPAPHERVAA
jgi:hypothetical protein